MRKSRSVSWRKVDYLEFSPWDLDVNAAGVVESMMFQGVACMDTLKDAKFVVPDFAVKSPWSDMGAAFSKLHVTDTKLSSFFKKNMGPKYLEPPDKTFFDEVTRIEANSRRITIKAGGDDGRSGVASKSASASSLDSITEKCKKIDTAERSKRLQELKAKSVAQLMEANKKKVIAIKTSRDKEA